MRLHFHGSSEDITGRQSLDNVSGIQAQQHVHCSQFAPKDQRKGGHGAEQTSPWPLGPGLLVQETAASMSIYVKLNH